MKIKLHAFLNVARLEISRFSLYFGIWVAARRAYERCCVLGLDVCLFSWRYNPLWLYYSQPGSGL